MSTSMIETDRFVYGYPTIRLSGVGVMSRSADCTSGNQA